MKTVEKQLKKTSRKNRSVIRYEIWFRDCNRFVARYNGMNFPEDGADFAFTKCLYSLKYNRIVSRDMFIPEENFVWCDTEDDLNKMIDESEYDIIDESEYDII